MWTRKSRSEHRYAFLILLDILVKFDRHEKLTNGEVAVLSDEERRFLLRVAREAIECELEGKEPPSYENVTPALNELRGAFVSLHTNGRLRGCIGYIEGLKSLLKTVQEVAAKAATQDPRFLPVTEDELPSVRLEISVLSPLELVTDIRSIAVGTHGLMLELGGRRGLLLPQVATELGWDTEAFLNGTAQKAGLPPDAWQHPEAKLYRFSAEVFAEEVKR